MSSDIFFHVYVKLFLGLGGEFPNQFFHVPAGDRTVIAALHIQSILPSDG